MLGKTSADLFAPEHAQAALRDEQEILRRGKPLVNMEEKETWPMGMRRGFPLQAPLQDPNGHVIRTFGLSLHFTRRSELKKNSRRSQENCATRMKPLAGLEMARE